MPLLLVQSFVNTRDLDLGTDLLAGQASASTWLREAGLLDSQASITAAGLKTAREVRESIRALLARNRTAQRPDPAVAHDLAPLRALAEAGRPRLAVHPDGRVQLAGGPVASLSEGLLSLLVVIRDAQQDGSWARLKTCGNPDCQWAFFDRSHSRQGSWCDMSSCGNLIKNRNLRARRRAH
jgi:predicted RNA-binding Zn ribbon-like protein